MLFVTCTLHIHLTLVKQKAQIHFAQHKSRDPIVDVPAKEERQAIQLRQPASHVWTFSDNIFYFSPTPIISAVRDGVSPLHYTHLHFFSAAGL